MSVPLALVATLCVSSFVPQRVEFSATRRAQARGHPVVACATEDALAFTAEETAALTAAANKPIGKRFGDVDSGSSMLKLKAASTNGPLAAQTWAAVREEHEILAEKSDEALATAFLKLEMEMIAARKGSGSGTVASSSGFGSSSPLLLALAIAVWAGTQYVGVEMPAMGGAAGDRPAVQTPLERYRAALLESTSEKLKSYER